MPNKEKTADPQDKLLKRRRRRRSLGVPKSVSIEA